MARVNLVKKARKDYPEKGIKKGDSYYWWAFRYGGKHVSKTYPRNSQLTQSEFLSTYYSAQESVEEATSNFSGGGDLADLISNLESAKDELEQLQSDCEDKVSNLENAFPGGSPTIDLLQARAESVESTMDELDDAISTLQDLETEQEEKDNKDDDTFEVGDKVTYLGEEYEVAEITEDSVVGGQNIFLKPTSEKGLTVRLNPKMTKEGKLEKVKDEDDDNWRSDAENAVSGINWDAE